MLDRETHQLRKKRNHALYRAAGLMGVAGVVDRTTGELLIDAGLLVGALSNLNALTAEETVRFKSTGDRLIAEREPESGKNTDPTGTAE